MTDEEAFQEWWDEYDSGMHFEPYGEEDCEAAWLAACTLRDRQIMEHDARDEERHQRLMATLNARIADLEAELANMCNCYEYVARKYYAAPEGPRQGNANSRGR